MNWTRIAADQLALEEQLRAEWDRLNRQRGDLPFMCSSAMLAALSVFARGREQLLIGRDDTGATVAMLLLEPVGHFRWQTFQPSQQPLGAWVSAADIGMEGLALDLLTSGRLDQALSLSLTQIDPLFSRQGADTSKCRHDPYIHTAWVDIVGSYDEYWAARGKNLRQNMKKQINRLRAEGILVETHRLEAAGEMASAVHRYGEIECRGWKAQSGTAITPTNDQGRYYMRLLSEAAGRGEAVVYELSFNGRTVASNLCLCRGTTMFMLKTTYDETLQGYSTAYLLHQFLLQELFEERRFSRLEYYGRVMEWHTRWTSNQRQLYHLTAFRWGWLKSLAARLTKPASGNAISHGEGSAGASVR